MLCSDIEYTIKTNCNKQQTLFINLEIIIQIYENLLSNSIRYAKSMIAIDVNKQEEFLLITVSDDGCGFKSTDIERVTLPFYKPSQDTTSEHLGLGLNICKILCERHGGTIKISNNHKGGSLCYSLYKKLHMLMKNRHFPHIIALSTYKGGFDYEKNYLYYFNNCHKHFVRVQFNIR